MSFPRDFIEDRLLSMEAIFSGQGQARPNSPERDMEMVDEESMLQIHAAAAPGQGLFM